MTKEEKRLINMMYDKKGNLTPIGKKVMEHRIKEKETDQMIISFWIFWIFVFSLGFYLLWESIQQLRIDFGRRKKTPFDLMIEENHKKRLADDRK